MSAALAVVALGLILLFLDPLGLGTAGLVESARGPGSSAAPLAEDPPGGDPTPGGPAHARGSLTCVVHGVVGFADGSPAAGRSVRLLLPGAEPDAEARLLAETDTDGAGRFQAGVGSQSADLLVRVRGLRLDSHRDTRVSRDPLQVGQPGPWRLGRVPAPEEAILPLRLQLPVDQRGPALPVGTRVRVKLLDEARSVTLAWIFDPASRAGQVSFPLGGGATRARERTKDEVVPTRRPLRVRWFLLAPYASSSVILHESVVAVVEGDRYSASSCRLDLSDVVAGTVVDPGGQPVPGVQVHIRFGAPRGAGAVQSVTMRTDADGRFVGPAQPGERMHIWTEFDRGPVDARDYAPMSRPAVQLPYRPFRLRVVHEDGSPVRACSILLSSRDGPPPGSGDPSLRPTDAGVVALPRRSLGESARWFVRCEEWGEARVWLPDDLGEHESGIPQLSLPAHPTTGRLRVSAAGKMPAGTVLLQLGLKEVPGEVPAGVPLHYLFLVTRDRLSGTVGFEGVQEGSYRLEIRALGQRSRLLAELPTRELRVVRGAEQRVEVSF